MSLFQETWLPTVLVILLSVLCSGYLYLTWNFSYWKRRDVNYLTPSVLFGNFGDLAMMRTNVGNLFRDLYQKGKGSDLFGIWIFRKPALVITSPELIRSILVKDFSYFTDRSTHTDKNHDPLGFESLFFGKKLHWKTIRNRLTPFFTSAKIKTTIFSIMKDTSKDLEECIRKQDGEPLEIREACERFSADVVAATVYGIKGDALSDKDSLFYQFRKRVVDMKFFRSIEFMSIFFMQGFAKFWKCKIFESDLADWLRNSFWKTVKERENQEERNDLVGMLMNLQKQTKDNDVIKFIGDSLVAQTTIFFTIGDSSSTCYACLYFITLNPDIQEKLADEILTVLEKYNNEITYEAVNEMSYLDMCVKETLRMFPPIPFIDRKCTSRYSVPGTNLVIEEGTDVYIPVLGIQTDEEYFTEADTFKPERFHKTEGDDIHPFTYLPFGEGPRSCIGQRYGLLQTKISLIRILMNFKLERCEKTQVPLKWRPLSLSPIPRDGIFVRFVNRENKHCGDSMLDNTPANILIRGN